MADPSYITKVYEKDGGDTQVIAAGGAQQVESGGAVNFQTGAALEFNGVDKTAALAAAVAAPAGGVAAGYKIARGVHTTVAASDDINTGLASVIAAVASLEDDPSTATLLVQAVVGDQAGTPAAGHILLKSWKPTANNDVTPTAATSFSKKVSWIAVGT